MACSRLGLAVSHSPGWSVAAEGHLTMREQQVDLSDPKSVAPVCGADASCPAHGLVTASSTCEFEVFFHCSPQAAKPQLHTNGRERDKGARDKTHPVRSVLGGDLAWKRTKLNPTNQNGEILSPS